MDGCELMSDGRTVSTRETGSPARKLSEAKNLAGAQAVACAMVEDYVKRDRWTILAVKIDGLLREVIEEMARV